RMAVRGPGKWQKAVQTPQPEGPFRLISLPEPGRIPQTTIERAKYEGNRPLSQEKRKRTGQHRRHRKDAQNDIEFARKNPPPELSPGAPLKSDSKGIRECGQRLGVIVIFEDPAQRPCIKALEPGYPYHFDGAKRR